MQQEQESFKVDVVVDTNSRKMHSPAKLAPAISKARYILLSLLNHSNSFDSHLCTLISYNGELRNLIPLDWVDDKCLQLLDNARDLIFYHWPEHYEVENCFIWWWTFWIFNGLLRLDGIHFWKCSFVRVLTLPFRRWCYPLWPSNIADNSFLHWVFMLGTCLFID